MLAMKDEAHSKCDACHSVTSQLVIRIVLPNKSVKILVRPCKKYGPIHTAYISYHCYAMTVEMNQNIKERWMQHQGGVERDACGCSS